MNQLTREDCIAMLQKKYEELKAQGRSDFPKRADFSEKDVVTIKSFLGPWPRALEAAGIKPVNEALMEKKRQKKIAMKRKKTQRKIEAKRKKAAAAAWNESGCDPSGKPSGGA